MGMDQWAAEQQAKIDENRTIAAKLAACLPDCGCRVGDVLYYHMPAAAAKMVIEFIQKANPKNA